MTQQTSHLTPHLTEAQLDDHLIGDLAPAAALHLAACALCNARMAAAAAPLTSFREVSSAWSDRRSATLPLRSNLASQPRLHHRFVLGAAAAAVLLVAINTLNHDPAKPALTPVADAATLAQPQPLTQLASTGPTDITAPYEQHLRDNITQDNQMLENIDNALDTSTESPATLGLVSISAPQQPPAISVED